MTHDELLSYIDDSTNGLKYDDIFPLLIANTQALRAVVELHKPDYKGTHWDCLMKDGDEGYPCPTIQAIEEEFK